MMSSIDPGVNTPRIWDHITSLILAFRFSRLTMHHKNNPMLFEVRKVQDSTRCILVSIPKRFANWMNIRKGSLVKIQFDSDEQDGNTVTISKVNLREQDN
jgi:hypothetical protein